MRPTLAQMGLLTACVVATRMDRQSLASSSVAHTQRQCIRRHLQFLQVPERAATLRLTSQVTLPVYPSAAPAKRIAQPIHGLVLT